MGGWAAHVENFPVEYGAEMVIPGAYCGSTVYAQHHGGTKHRPSQHWEGEVGESEWFGDLRTTHKQHGGQGVTLNWMMDLVVRTRYCYCTDEI